MEGVVTRSTSWPEGPGKGAVVMKRKIIRALAAVGVTASVMGSAGTTPAAADCINYGPYAYAGAYVAPAGTGAYIGVPMPTGPTVSDCFSQGPNLPPPPAVIIITP